jgi:hypothetical protein
MSDTDYISRVRNNVPGILPGLPVWLLWKESRNPGEKKAKKMPFYANGKWRNKTDTPDDRAQLVTFEEAACAFDRARASGLGIALGAVPGEDIHISGIDLDHCYNEGALDARAQQLVDVAGSYVEKSPGGSGLHILGTGDVGTVKDDQVGLEIYSGGRYFTVTGERIRGERLADLRPAAALGRALYGKTESTRQSQGGDRIQVEEGQRHNRCLTKGKLLRQAGFGADEVEAVLLEYNRLYCVPPLPEVEIRNIARWCAAHAAPEANVETIRASLLSDLSSGAESIDNAEPPHWVVHELLPEAGANLAGAGGAGKTTVTLNEYVHIVCGGHLYGRDVVKQGPCVLITAEDGAAYPRYILRRVLADGIASGALPERAAHRAKEAIKIVGWSRPTFGSITNVDRDGVVTRAPGFDVLLDVLEPLSPAVVTFDPLALFSPGERFGNDGEAFLASMLHEAALRLNCAVQVLDHVSQAVAVSGTVHQHAARGGTAKTDNARMARQLVTFRPRESDTTGQPLSVTPDDIARHRILQLHWTKMNYGPLPPFVWLRRRGHWVEYLPSPSADEIAAGRACAAEKRAEADTQGVVEAVRQAVTRGAKPTVAQLEEWGVPGPNGKMLTRGRIRAAASRGLAAGHLRLVDLPAGERKGARKHYLMPAGGGP